MSGKGSSIATAGTYGERSPSVRELIKKTLSKENVGSNINHGGGGMNGSSPKLRQEPPLRRKVKKTSSSSEDEDEYYIFDHPPPSPTSNNNTLDGPSSSSASLTSSNEFDVKTEGSGGITSKPRKPEKWKEFILQSKQEDKRNFERDFLLADLNAWLEGSSVIPLTPRTPGPNNNIHNNNGIIDPTSNDSVSNWRNNIDDPKPKLQKRASSHRELSNVAKMPTFKTKNTLRRLKRENGEADSDGEEEGGDKITKSTSVSTKTKKGSRREKRELKKEKKEKAKQEKKERKEKRRGSKRGKEELERIEKRRSGSLDESGLIGKMKKKDARLRLKLTTSGRSRTEENLKGANLSQPPSETKRKSRSTTPSPLSSPAKHKPNNHN